MLWIQLIAQVGVEVAYNIWREWQNKNNPTEADWQRLLTLSRKTAQQYKDEASQLTSG